MLLPKIYPVTCHTDHVGPGSTFVAIKGFVHDGTQYIPQALKLGAAQIVVDTTAYTPELEALCAQYDAECIATDNTRQTLATMASRLLDDPASTLTIIGITGTKGKSTTAYLLHHILQQAGHKTALLSTIVNKIHNKTEASARTTPESDYLHMFFDQCVKQGVTHVVMEVSSHALSLHRVHGIFFDAVGFTNLAPEHLDFYSSMDDYFAAKATLFNQVKPGGLIVINGDNEWGAAAYEAARPRASEGVDVVTFGEGASFDQTQDKLLASARPWFETLLTQLLTTSAHPEEAGGRLEGVEGYERPHIPIAIHQASCDGIQLALALRPTIFLECPQLFGTFNCYNIAMASIIAIQLDVSYTALIRALNTFPGVPGRLQRHQLANGALAFVDYAHNPSSFKEVLSTLRPYTQQLIVVFGCGGNRDATKRPVMGELAAAYGDVVIVTSDNPRFEEPATIIKEIIAGIPADQAAKVQIYPDRATAIEYAASIAGEDAIIALLGKGHEPYYECQGQTTHFDDMEEIGQY